VPASYKPITQRNVAKGKPSESSWSYDMEIMDFANDDDFTTCWTSEESVAAPYWQVELPGGETINMISILEGEPGAMGKYRISYRNNGQWLTLCTAEADKSNRFHQHEFAAVKADAVRIDITERHGKVQFYEIGVYAPAE